MNAWLAASPASIDHAWIDHNGHAHLPCYTVLFIRAISEAMDHLGIGAAYTARGRGTFFGAENHVRYLGELRADDVVRVKLCLVNCDTKRLHWGAHMTSGDCGRIAATFELLSLHVEQATRRVVPMPDAIFESARDLHMRQQGVGPFGAEWRLDLNRRR
ncbi:putative thioesterase [Burkholderia sp. Ch1-1]|jgi:acyl-CoA thioester hydrolase|nr:putative thioesterase [Burkholderia sp. Ch1-1]